MRSSFLTLAAVLALALGFAAGPVAAQDPGLMNLPTTPDPALCTVEPRTVEDLVALYPEGTLAAAESLAVAAPEPFVLAGEPADPDTVAAVTGAIVNVLACANTGDFFRVLSLVTDRFLTDPVEGFGPEPGLTQEEIEAQIRQFAEMPVEAPPEDQRSALLDVVAVRLLPDGRVGALLVDLDPATRPDPTLTYVEFVEEDGRYLLDRLVEDPYDLTPGYGLDAEAAAGEEDAAGEEEAELDVQAAELGEEGTPVAAEGEEAAALEGVTFDPVAYAPAVDLPSPADLVALRLTLDAGAAFPLDEADPSIALFVVEAGAFTVRAEAPLTVTRAGALAEAVTAAEAGGPFAPGAEEVAAGEEVVLGPGDIVLFPANIPGEVRNLGEEEAIGLAFLIAPPEETAAGEEGAEVFEDEETEAEEEDAA